MTSVESQASEAQENEPVVEIFSIIGLHGTKDLHLETKNSVSILMARNGSGKTTLLAAINSVLTRQYQKLAHINFERMDVKLRGAEAFSITKNDVSEFFKQQEIDSGISEIAEETEVNVDEIISLARRIGSIQNVRADREYMNIYNRHPSMNFKSLTGALYEYNESMFHNSPNLKKIDLIVSEATRGYEIVYLPTYRRIEMSLEAKTQTSKPTPPWARRDREPTHLLPTELNFGLSDITDRLSDINKEIQGISNTTYQKISANIVNDLLDGSYLDQDYQTNKPDRSELELFFNRIKDTKRRIGAGIAVPNIEKIYSDDLEEGVKPFLLYFLSNLNEAIRSTKPLEDRVNGFVRACNQYLNDEDFSAVKGGSVGPLNVETKEIRINRENFRPFFVGGGGESKIGIDSLSSGEKQVVALFAKLYLYDKKKIVLYDEPELSLSIGWQTKLLPDLCASPDFSQLISITHSPFVFDNDLDRFASNLDVSVYRKDEPELDFEEEIFVEGEAIEIGLADGSTTDGSEI
ncbi:AAA family ATPase [Phaeobacter sp. 11ANDIMAR09]|uniref:AAA family ATPase n=1 Tax=Phaeobacter sp. 11ANDIMAR09 TaxID=1225647 RepID=UPI0006C8D0F3|nr:AAA family ATPase [Phaeobacter sp. 11ANDIMAR09]KPD10509.1 hypothetical protein AN476_20600 [Phaeobacter sp. 11ANDIMAR09]